MRQNPKAHLCFCYLVSKTVSLSLLSRQKDKANSYGSARKFKTLSGQNDVVAVEGLGTRSDQHFASQNLEARNGLEGIRG